MSNITFAIFTYNEEKRIPYVIKNFIKYGDVMIFDGGSTDGTQEICEKLGASFFERPTKNRPETPENLAFIKSKIRTSWLYWGYADNMAPKSLIERFIEISEKNVSKMVMVPLYAYLWGNTENFALKSYEPIFFHKDCVKFVDKIHHMAEPIDPNEQFLILPNKSECALLHFSAYDANKFIGRHLHYANVEALDKFQSGERFSMLKTLAAMLRYCWIYKGALRNVKLGLIIMLSHAFSRFLVYVRLYEIENGITLESVERNYDKEREKMLEDF